MSKTIITSDVKALTEMIIDNKTGLIHQKDNIDDLSRLLDLCLTNENLNKRLGKNAIEWVTLNRTWDEISEKVNSIYEKLIMESEVTIPEI